MTQLTSPSTLPIVENCARDAMTQIKKKRYFVATQDQELRRALAYVPGVPLIYLNKVTLVFETPSQSSLQFNKNVSRNLLSCCYCCHYCTFYSCVSVTILFATAGAEQDHFEHGGNCSREHSQRRQEAQIQ